MNYRKITASLCIAALLLSSAGCSSDNGEPVEIKTPTVTTDAESVEETKTTTDSSEKSMKATTSSTTKTTPMTSISSTAQTTKSNASATTTNKNTVTASNNSKNTNSNSNNIQQNANISASGENTSQDTAAPSAGETPANAEPSSGNTNVESNTENNAVSPVEITPVEEEPEPTEQPVDDTIYITLNGSSAQVSDANAVAVNGGIITIQLAGRYEVSGTLSDGQIIVNVGKEDKVNLHFNGVGITCSDSAPLYVMSAGTCTLHLDSGSTNYVQDTASNALSACISSKDDLTIKGEGKLTVIGNKKHGIKSSNDVKIKNGCLTVSSVSTAIYGEDSVQVTGGSIVITACKDGLKASNVEEADKGYVSVEDGYIDIQNAAGNGIEAITGVTISGGTVNVHSTKKSINCDYQSIADGCFFEY